MWNHHFVSLKFPWYWEQVKSVVVVLKFREHRSISGMIRHLLHHLTEKSSLQEGRQRKSNWWIPGRHWTAKWGGRSGRSYILPSTRPVAAIVVVVMVATMVILVGDATRAYKLHTIALNPRLPNPFSTVPCVQPRLRSDPSDWFI